MVHRPEIATDDDIEELDTAKKFRLLSRIRTDELPFNRLDETSCATGGGGDVDGVFNT